MNITLKRPSKMLKCTKMPIDKILDSGILDKGKPLANENNKRFFELLYNHIPGREIILNGGIYPGYYLKGTNTKKNVFLSPPYLLPNPTHFNDEWEIMKCENNQKMLDNRQKIIAALGANLMNMQGAMRTAKNEIQALKAYA